MTLGRVNETHGSRIVKISSDDWAFLKELFDNLDVKYEFVNSVSDLYKKSIKNSGPKPLSEMQIKESCDERRASFNEILSKYDKLKQ